MVIVHERQRNTPFASGSVIGQQIHLQLKFFASEYTRSSLNTARLVGGGEGLLGPDLLRFLGFQST